MMDKYIKTFTNPNQWRLIYVMQAGFSKEVLFISSKSTKQSWKQGQKPKFQGGKLAQSVIAPGFHKNRDESHFLGLGGVMHTDWQWQIVQWAMERNWGGFWLKFATNFSD